MDKGKTNTKSRILEVSLNLFSQRGYSSVSIRDICGEVGIKESSIYSHFKNKREIFEILCEMFTDTTYRISLKFTANMSEKTKFSDEEFLSACQRYLNDYLIDDKINKFIRMLIIEQSTNPQAAALYHMVLFDKALAGQQAIFQWLVKIGYLIDSDVESMVIEYYAPIVYFFHRYLVAETITEEIREEVNRKVIKHAKFFLAEYKRKIPDVGEEKNE